MMTESRDPAIKLFGMKIHFPAVLKSSLADEEDEEEVMELNGGDDKSSDKLVPELSDNDNKPETGDKEETASTNSEDGKTLKKPTKILPCPRCKSMDTKFCYYNNYNINQPRHFCKACQRYWTAGGTMRSVPVGAGRRKNKSHRHMTISEALGANTQVLSFGLENGDDRSCASSSVITSVDESQTSSYNNNNNMNGYACIPWAYTWNPATPPPAGYYPPMPFYPYWTIPMLSPTLGKHPGEEESDENKRKQSNGCILVPKTLRIDDPNEAAKSSIWTTLGIKNEGMMRIGGMFKGFDEKKNDKEKDKCSVLSANPAALSRSLDFHERV